jgi:hypothetical protein
MVNQLKKQHYQLVKCFVLLVFRLVIDHVSRYSLIPPCIIKTGRSVSLKRIFGEWSFTRGPDLTSVDRGKPGILVRINMISKFLILLMLAAGK